MEQDESTKDNLLEIAIKLFGTKGYDAIGVMEICNEGNVTKPTLYYYFGSKAGILKEIADTKGNELVMLILKASEYIHDFQLTLTKLYKTVIEFAQKNPEFFRLHCVLLNSPANSEGYSVYKEVGGAIQKLFDDFFDASCAELGNMRGKEKLYSSLFANNVTSLAQSVIQNNLNVTDELIYQVVHSFVYGVAS